MKTKFKLVGYCRVSTDNQREEKTVEIQENALREYAKANGYDLVKVFKDEGISGAKELENRPGLVELFDFIESDKNISGVLIYKLDRLARDLRIQENLIFDIQKRKNKEIISIQEPDLLSNDPNRILMRQILGSFAQYEKSVIAWRLGTGRTNKARKGFYAGGGPSIGYKSIDKELVIDTEQAETVKLIFYLKRYKQVGLRGIARHLNELGIPTARGGQWHARTVKYILENPKYRGSLSYNGNVSKRLDLAIV